LVEVVCGAQQRPPTSRAGRARIDRTVDRYCLVFSSMHIAFKDWRASAHFSKWFAMRRDHRPPRSAEVRIACAEFLL
jgi:hypothetical protein